MASLESGTRLVQSKYGGYHRRLMWTCNLACVGAFCCGYTVGYSSPAIPSMIKAQVLTKENAGWFGSYMTIGAIFGGPAGGWSIEKFGRRKSLMITSVPFLLGWLAMLSSSGLTYLFAGRFLTGFSSGLVTVCVPVYIAEISTKSMRGISISLTQIFLTFGIFLSYLYGLYFDWWFMTFVAMAPPGLMLLTSFVIPESPHWLLGQNKKAEAVQALQALRDPHADVHEELHDIEESLGRFTWSAFLKNQEISRPLFISCAIVVLQQLSGINAVMFYTVSIFETTIPDVANAATVAVGAIQIVGTLAGCVYIHRAGRRRMLIISGLIMASALFIFGLHRDKVASEKITEVSWSPAACLMAYIVGFSLGWGPIPVPVMAGNYPAKVRGAASSVVALVNWITAFVVTENFMTIQSSIGESGVFHVFGVFCVMSVLFVWKYLPETVQQGGF